LGPHQGIVPYFWEEYLDYNLDVFNLWMDLRWNRWRSWARDSSGHSMGRGSHELDMPWVRCA